MSNKDQYQEERKRLVAALLEFVERAAKENATAEEVGALSAVAGRLAELIY